MRDSDNDWKLESYHLQQIGDQISEDKRIAERIDTYKNQVQTKYFDQFKMKFDEVLAVAPFNFQTVNRITKNHQEDPLGNVILGLLITISIKIVLRIKRREFYPDL